MRPARSRPLLDIAGDDILSPDARTHHVHSLAPARVELTELRLGRMFLERWRVCEIHPDNDWRADHYVSNAPATFTIRDVVVHSSAGLLRIDNEIVSETVAFSNPVVHGYTENAEGLMLRPSRMTTLSGRHVTTLYGLANNHYHSLIDGVARLSVVPRRLLQSARGVLHADGAVAQAFALTHSDLPATQRARPVAPDEAFHVEELILPLSLHHNGKFHPCLNAFFDEISARVTDDGRDLPRRFYVDRRGSPSRRLINESELIDRLRPLGFVPVRPETLCLADQLRLFRNADAIVAPHGAGLTNIGWCRPGCAILELHMDAYAHWFFRHLAGLRSLDYDCIFGRAVDPWPEDRGRTEHVRWVISADHVVAGASHILTT